MEQVPTFYDRSEGGYRKIEERPSLEFPVDDEFPSDRQAMALAGYQAKKSPDGKFIKWEPIVKNSVDAEGEGSMDKAA